MIEEGDSTPIFTTLADPRASLSSFGHLIQDMCKLARALQSLEINSVTKRCNRAAYTLAVEENNQKAHVVWRDKSYFNYYSTDRVVKSCFMLNFMRCGS